MKGYESVVKELIDSEREWKNSERMVYVTIPVVKDAKLMLKALEGIHKSVFLAISGILKFEYLFKRIELNKDVDKNLEVFFSKCSKRYGLTSEDCEVIKEIFKMNSKHKSSASEFVRLGKVIIMSDDLKTTSLSFDRLKIYLSISRKLLNSAISSIKSY
jgi:hypothetical protein